MWRIELANAHTIVHMSSADEGTLCTLFWIASQTWSRSELGLRLHVFIGFYIVIETIPSFKTHMYS